MYAKSAKLANFYGKIRNTQLSLLLPIMREVKVFIEISTNWKLANQVFVWSL